MLCHSTPPLSHSTYKRKKSLEACATAQSHIFGTPLAVAVQEMNVSEELS